MRWSAPRLLLMPRSLHRFGSLRSVLHMIGETIIACSNGAHLPFGFCVIQEFRDGAKLLSSLVPILGIVDERMGQGIHAKCLYPLAASHGSRALRDRSGSAKYHD